VTSVLAQDGRELPDVVLSRGCCGCRGNEFDDLTRFLLETGGLDGGDWCVKELLAGLEHPQPEQMPRRTPLQQTRPEQTRRQMKSRARGQASLRRSCSCLHPLVQPRRPRSRLRRSLLGLARSCCGWPGRTMGLMQGSRGQLKSAQRSGCDTSPHRRSAQVYLCGRAALAQSRTRLPDRACCGSPPLAFRGSGAEVCTACSTVRFEYDVRSHSKLSSAAPPIRPRAGCRSVLGSHSRAENSTELSDSQESPTTDRETKSHPPAEHARILARWGVESLTSLAPCDRPAPVASAHSPAADRRSPHRPTRADEDEDDSDTGKIRGMMTAVLNET
jgi:hypothetical protein